MFHEDLLILSKIGGIGSVTESRSFQTSKLLWKTLYSVS